MCVAVGGTGEGRGTASVAHRLEYCRLRGRGETDQLGVPRGVHAPSQEQVSLTLDTSGRPELRPQSPSLAFVAGESSELVLLQVKFAEPAPRRKARAPFQGPIELKH